MFKLALILFCAIIAFSIHETKSESPGQCNNYCLDVLKPLLENMIVNQNRWNEWDSIKLNETQTRLEGVENQLRLLKEKLSLLKPKEDN